MESIPSSSSDLKNEIEISERFCETCQTVVSGAFSSREHYRHKISTVDEFAGGVKRKLHELLGENEKDEKNLAKAAKIVSDCNKSTQITTQSSLMEKLYSMIHPLNEINKTEVESIDKKKEIEAKEKTVKDVVQELNDKQSFIRNLLSKGNEALVNEIDKVFAEGSHFRSNVELTLPYMTETKEDLKSRMEILDMFFTSDLVKRIQQYIRNMEMVQNMSSVHLSHSRNLKVGIGVFRAFLPDNVKIVSCDSFLCIGHFDEDNEVVNLEFITEAKSKTLTVDTDIEVARFFGCKNAVAVQVGKDRALVYQSLDEEALEIVCGEKPVGMIKIGNDFVFLNSSDGNPGLKWVPEGSLPAIPRVAGKLWTSPASRSSNFASHVSSDAAHGYISAVMQSKVPDDRKLFICVYKRGFPDVHFWTLDKSKDVYHYLTSKRDDNLGIGFVSFFAMRKHLIFHQFQAMRGQ